MDLELTGKRGSPCSDRIQGENFPTQALCHRAVCLRLFLLIITKILPPLQRILF